MNTHSKLALISIVISFLINAYYIFANYYAVSENGTNTHLWVSIFLMLPAFVCLLIAPVFLIATVFKKYRSQSLSGFIMTAIFFASAFIGIQVGGMVRENAFLQLAKRSNPLISAIEDHQKERGSLPQSLNDLVPDFLPGVPKTQMGAYPEYIYYVGEKAQQYAGNPWVLVIHTPSGGINWDMFMYFPLQNYPETAYVSSLELIGKWAYVHE